MENKKKSARLEALKEDLQKRCDEMRDIVTSEMAELGLKSEDCQLACIRSGIYEVEKMINGIVEEDLVRKYKDLAL